MPYESQILVGRERICEYLVVNKKVFYALLSNGLPVAKVGDRWMSHKAVLDDWARALLDATGQVGCGMVIDEFDTGSDK